MKLFEPLVRHADALLEDALGPLGIPRNPWLMAHFGMKALQSAERLVHRAFDTERARALLAGNAAHPVLSFDQPISAAAALMLTLAAHAYGWPVARGGSQSIADALAAYFKSLGGMIAVESQIESLSDLPAARVVIFDLSPKAVAAICGEALPVSFRDKLRRYRHGPAAFKVDWALSEPIPWRAEVCRRAGTVHVGGTFAEVAAAEAAPWAGCTHERPFVLVGQQSVIDPTRAPVGKHVGWAYCHVPAGNAADVTEAIEAQVERFAPGFRQTILVRAVMRPADFEAYNANYVGGDIVGGILDWRQMFARPTLRWNPYTTPNPRIYLCSASTPPGAGVHGMCGLHAARTVLERSARSERKPF